MQSKMLGRSISHFDNLRKTVCRITNYSIWFGPVSRRHMGFEFARSSKRFSMRLASRNVHSLWFEFKWLFGSIESETDGFQSVYLQSLCNAIHRRIPPFLLLLPDCACNWWFSHAVQIRTKSCSNVCVPFCCTISKHKIQARFHSV